MQGDLRDLLANWPYDPEKNLRVARGADNREILQVRLPLGIEQIELDGRPDGLRPHDRESLLDFHLQRLTEAKTAGQAADFRLAAPECAALFEEGTTYYFRYLHCFQLKDWTRTVRDTARNIRLFDFVRRYAAREEDRQHLEKWRPYIVRMNAIARTMLELESEDYGAALHVLAEAAEKIENLEPSEDETFKFERRRSLTALRELAAQIEQTRPISELERLEQQLHRAIQAQEFERAAALRDRIRELRKKR